MTIVNLTSKGDFPPLQRRNRPRLQSREMPAPEDITASSDEVELCDVCDRVLVLRDGQLAGELSRDQMTPEEIARLEL